VVEGAKMITITGNVLIDSFIVGCVSVIFFAIYPFYVDSVERYVLNPGLNNLIYIIVGTALGTGIGDFTTYILVKAFRQFVEAHPDNRLSLFLAPRMGSIDQLNPGKGTRVFLFAFLSGSLPLNDHVIMSVQGFTKQNRTYVFTGLLLGKFVLAIWILGAGNVLLTVTQQTVTNVVYYIAAGLTIGMVIIMWKTKGMTMVGFSLMTFDLLIAAAIFLLISYEVSHPTLLTPRGEQLFAISFLCVLVIFLISVLVMYSHKPGAVETWRNIAVTSLIVLGLFFWYGYQTVYQSMTPLLWSFVYFMVLTGAATLLTSLFAFWKKPRQTSQA